MTHEIRERQSTVDRSWAIAMVGLLCVLLSACSGTPITSGFGDRASSVRAERLAAAGDHQAAASMYVSLAGEQAGDARDRYTLLAVQQWILATDERRAAVALSNVREPEIQPLRNDWLLTTAALYNLRGNGERAVATLAESSAGDFSLSQRIAAEGIRGEALFLEDQPAEALATLQRRELWLNSQQEIASNHSVIWDGLLQASPDALQTAFADTRNEEARGWLALGMLADGSTPGGPVRGLSAWQRAYMGHPANEFIVPGILGSDAVTDIGSAEHIALLLTLSGRTAVVGEAVRDGFLARYSEHYQGRSDAPVVEVYDVAKLGATLAYQRALESGADFVVGPVLRSPVDELQAGGALTAPTLLLNYLPIDAMVTGDVYQFGLAPEDEARAAARRAYAEGHRRALALVPASNWGERVLAAFNTEFSALGGAMLDHQTFVAREPDYKNEIQTLLLLNDSVSRYRSMRSTLGGTLQFEPRRRADADFIFVGASSDSAKRLKPQLRFHYAGDLPVFATSAVNATRSTNNSDLNGIRFSDIRWLVDRMAEDITPLQTIGGYFPSANAQPRLFALGYDAFDVLKRIVDPDPDASAVITGATGDLELDAYGRIRRAPLWATFTRESAVPLPPLVLPVAETPAFDDRHSQQEFIEPETSTLER
ncbi:MAG: penicillin-binding protein activator [Pseudomonadota bacterium]